MKKQGKFKLYLISILIPLAVGALAAIFTKDAMESFSQLRQPALSPPGALFPIVWSVLYVLMGVSAGLVAASGDLESGEALFWYAAQLFANFFWPIFFFAWEMRLFSFIWLLALIILVVVMIQRFWRIRPAAGALNLPYLLWLVFAAWLNLSVWLLNK